jgi:hypothetical protein
MNLQTFPGTTRSNPEDRAIEASGPDEGTCSTTSCPILDIARACITAPCAEAFHQRQFTVTMTFKACPP